MKKRYPNGYNNNIYFKSLANFYRNKQKRIVSFEELYKGEVIYQGNDLRTFNRQLLEGNLPKLYLKIFNEMSKGFDVMEVKKNNKDKAINLIKFLSIYPYVEIRCKNEGK